MAVHLEELPSRLQKLGLVYHLPGPAPELEISRSEQRLNVSFPAQVRQFYQNYNGLRVENPQLEILSVETLNLTSGDRLHFATVDFQLLTLSYIARTDRKIRQEDRPESRYSALRFTFSCHMTGLRLK